MAETKETDSGQETVARKTLNEWGSKLVILLASIALVGAGVGLTLFLQKASIDRTDKDVHEVIKSVGGLEAEVKTQKVRIESLKNRLAEAENASKAIKRIATQLEGTETEIGKLKARASASAGEAERARDVVVAIGRQWEDTNWPASVERLLARPQPAVHEFFQLHGKWRADRESDGANFVVMTAVDDNARWNVRSPLSFGGPMTELEMQGEAIRVNGNAVAVVTVTGVLRNSIGEGLVYVSVGDGEPGRLGGASFAASRDGSQPVAFSLMHFVPAGEFSPRLTLDFQSARSRADWRAHSFRMSVLVLPIHPQAPPG